MSGFCSVPPLSLSFGLLVLLRVKPPDEWRSCFLTPMMGRRSVKSRNHNRVFLLTCIPLMDAFLNQYIYEINIGSVSHFCR